MEEYVKPSTLEKKKTSEVCDRPRDNLVRVRKSPLGSLGKAKAAVGK